MLKIAIIHSNARTTQATKTNVNNDNNLPNNERDISEQQKEQFRFYEFQMREAY